MNTPRLRFLPILCLIAASSLCAQDSLIVRLVGQINYWDTAYDVKVVGEYDFCATGISELR
jgi:hypothetical protein